MSLNNTLLGALGAAQNGSDPVVPRWMECPDPSVCEDQDVGDNVGLAFGLTVIAGLATTIGALAPFVPAVKLANKKLLAAGLGGSAGVMLYVSFVEIFAVKALDAFCCVTEKYNTVATATFFGGMLFTVLLHMLVHQIEKFDSLACRRRVRTLERKVGRRVCRNDNGGKAQDGNEPAATDDGEDGNEGGSAAVVEMTEDGVATIGFDNIEPHILHRKGSYIEAVAENGGGGGGGDAEGGGDIRVDDLADFDPDTAYPHAEHDREQNTRLKRMGVMTAVAIGIHNFPEGLATFIAALSDAKLGAAMAVAISLHNIPEGLCVAMPVYYATGSKWRAFFWAFLSGLSEPIGALLGYAFLKDSITPTAYAVLFGLVSGMMVYIALKELLPTALRYDPKNQVVTLACVIGMAFMSLSLVLFADI